MDISTSGKSLVIIYYLSSLYFLKATQTYMPKDTNIQQKNIRHSRSRSHFLIDNRHETITHSPNYLKESINTKSYLESELKQQYVNRTMDEDASFVYIYEADEISHPNDDNPQAVDVESVEGTVTSSLSVFNYDDSDINKSLFMKSGHSSKFQEQFETEHDDINKKLSVLSTSDLIGYNADSMFVNNSFLEFYSQKSFTKSESDDELQKLMKTRNVSNFKSTEEQFSSFNEKNEHKINENDDTKKIDGVVYPNKHVDIVTRFLRIVESQHLLGENCTAGTDLNLGEGVVDRYAQERFRIEADVAVNRANMLTRLWKYSDHRVVMSEYFLHASVFSMVEFDDDIFAAGNCYDQYQYKDYWLFCPYAYRLPEGQILVKDLAVEYKYLSNTSEWFYIARKNAEKVIKNYNHFSRGFNTYTWNESIHTERVPDEILSVTYEDGKWSKPYYDCGGGNIWMLTYTVPFFGFQNNSYYFKGTSGIDIDLRRVDIDQCPLPKNSNQLNIFAASDKCKKRTTDCIPLPGLGFRRGSYKCVCRRGFYFPDTKAEQRYYNGTILEEEYEKLIMGEKNIYSLKGTFECLECAEGCEFCEDNRPCVISLNWIMRTAILILSCIVISCLPIVILFTWKFQNIKVVRAASPVLLRVIILGAFLIYCTNIVMYPRPNIYTCTVRVWLREIGFSLTYGALMLKTWRISIIFRVKSAKAVKITDMNLLKRLGIILSVFCALLIIRTLVAPPHVIIGKTTNDLKAYLCKTDWWDHSFTTMEVLFLVWGIRLCIVVRKAPSEFNESKFISMAIYNEFLLSIFLNISMHIWSFVELRKQKRVQA